ncbi:uncharacterized protein [Vicugna pacos]|uniref:Uncharacterized protein n=1 Tax=Vicugna pacos TaxID=30538 RepID=A0ABM5DBJ1_VICPA
MARIQDKQRLPGAATQQEIVVPSDLLCRSTWQLSPLKKPMASIAAVDPLQISPVCAAKAPEALKSRPWSEPPPVLVGGQVTPPPDAASRRCARARRLQVTPPPDATRAAAGTSQRCVLAPCLCTTDTCRKEETKAEQQRKKLDHSTVQREALADTLENPKMEWTFTAVPSWGRHSVSVILPYFTVCKNWRKTVKNKAKTIILLWSGFFLCALRTSSGNKPEEEDVGWSRSGRTSEMYGYNLDIQPGLQKAALGTCEWATAYLL